MTTSARFAGDEIISEGRRNAPFALLRGGPAGEEEVDQIEDVGSIDVSVSVDVTRHRHVEHPDFRAHELREEDPPPAVHGDREGIAPRRRRVELLDDALAYRPDLVRAPGRVIDPESRAESDAPRMA